jgi:hypothetical protein
MNFKYSIKTTGSLPLTRRMGSTNNTINIAEQNVKDGGMVMELRSEKQGWRGGVGDESTRGLAPEHLGQGERKGTQTRGIHQHKRVGCISRLSSPFTNEAQQTELWRYNH